MPRALISLANCRPVPLFKEFFFVDYGIGFDRRSKLLDGNTGGDEGIDDGGIKHRDKLRS